MFTRKYSVTFMLQNKKNLNYLKKMVVISEKSIILIV
jgi:hypothetical protein